MWKKLIYSTLLIPCFAISCATGPDETEKINIEGKWEFEGLGQLEINTINEETSPMLFSTSNGIYSKNENGFTEFGLQDKEVVDLVKLPQGEYMAAIQASGFEVGDTTLFIKLNNEWSSNMGDYGGDNGNYTWVSALEISPHHHETLSGANLAKSTNGGQSWESVYYDWGTIGFTNFITFAQTDNKLIYAGGENAIFQPSLIRSEDGGDNWEILSIPSGEANNNDLILNYSNSEQIMIGLSGSYSAANTVKQSLDNGETWSTVYEGAGIYTFTRSVRNPEIIYASGITAERSLFFLATANFGETWKTAEFAESPSNIYVNDMVSVLEDGEEVLYFGTTNGVYSYTFEE